MSNSSPSTNSQVARILFKQIVAGDLRKIEAQSNDSDTGGGARDFRFGSYSELLPIIKRMFPTVVRENRRRGSTTQLIDVYKGKFYWQDDPSVPPNSKDSYFEPPTDVRPSEGRIVRVHEYPCFDISRIPVSGPGNRVLILLIQRADETVWPHFAEESSIRTPGVWDATVAEVLIRCLCAKRAESRAAIGYYDFISHKSYCNGK